MKQHHKLLIALCVGAVLGTLLHSQSDVLWMNNLTKFILEPVGQVFLRLIFMIVVPMVFSGLVLGVFQLSHHHGLGSVVSKTLIFTIISSITSVLVGVTLVNIFKPGAQFEIPAGIVSSEASSIEKIQGNVKAAKPLVQSLLEIIPKNPIDAAARALDGEMLALMCFALIFGIAASQIFKNKNSNSLIPLLEDIYEACMQVVGFAMKLAPYAVFCLVFSSTFKFGSNLVLSLLAYMAVVVMGLAIQQFVVYASMLKYIGGRSPWQFFKDCRDVYIYAFATASSNATLPTSLDTAEHKLKLPPAISRFVLTVGSTANQNGTALFEGITVLFLAQVYKVDLSFAQQLQVVLMSVLAGIGTAGVPGGSLPLIMILLQQVGIPPEGLGLILGVDRFLDMCRTTVNVSGDLVIAALVSGKKSRS